MSMGNIICENRKRLGLTQDGLAQKLGVTNQAVSKWETDQSLPDLTLLPQIADVFGITIDAFFGRMPAAMEVIPVKQEKGVELPWEDDEAFHVVLFCGHTLIGKSEGKEDINFCYEGPAKDIYSDFSVECEDVHGNVTAGTYVECGDVAGTVCAGTYVECGNVEGKVSCFGYSKHEHTGKADFSGVGKSSAKFAKEISDKINNEIMNDYLGDFLSDMFGEKKNEG